MLRPPDAELRRQRRSRAALWGSRRQIESLIPPFNLDCYFQHFSLRGAAAPLGQLGPWPTGWTPIDRGLANAHAVAPEIGCDAASGLESVELWATCSEGVLGLAGLAALSAEASAAGTPRWRCSQNALGTENLNYFQTGPTLSIPRCWVIQVFGSRR
jgi:hypothetical protein